LASQFIEFSFAILNFCLLKSRLDLGKVIRSVLDEVLSTNKIIASPVYLSNQRMDCINKAARGGIPIEGQLHLIAGHAQRSLENGLTIG